MFLSFSGNWVSKGNTNDRSLSSGIVKKDSIVRLWCDPKTISLTSEN